MVAILAAFVASCSEDTTGRNTPPHLVLSESGVTNIYRTGATLEAALDNKDSRDISETGFIISTSTDFENLTMDAIRMSSACRVLTTENPVKYGKFSMAATGLAPNTKYYYCAYVYSGFSIARSETGSFSTTSSNEPIFTDPIVSNVTLSSADISFALVDIGGEDEVQTMELRWKPVAEGEVVTDLNSGNITAATSNNGLLRDLQKDTRYAVWVHCYTTGGRNGYSKVAYFTTLNYEVSFSGSPAATSGSTFSIHYAFNTAETVLAKGVCYSLENEEPNISNRVAFDNDMSTSDINVVSPTLINATYYVRPFVKINKDGKEIIVYGNVQKVNISNGALPTLSETTVNDVSAFNAGFFATCTAHGGVKPYEYGFYYAEGNVDLSVEQNRNFAAIVTVPSSQVGPDLSFSYFVSNLADDREYSVCAYAINSNGINFGPTRMFHTTKRVPQPGDIEFPE